MLDAQEELKFKGHHMLISTTKARELGEALLVAATLAERTGRPYQVVYNERLDKAVTFSSLKASDETTHIVVLDGAA